MSDNKNKDYVSVIYNESQRPFTNYPKKLTKYLFNRFNLKKDQKILDIGCGRGEFLNGFIDCGLNGYAADQSSAVLDYFPKTNLKISDIEKDGIPYSNTMFDVVFAKSVIEHFYDPNRLMQEIYRILKPGGILILMTPSWEYNYKVFFEDYTHRSPFMFQSLKDVNDINGFEKTKVEYFYQLPILWKYKWLKPFSQLTTTLAPDFLKKKFKWVKWSKEIMLLSTSFKL